MFERMENFTFTHGDNQCLFRIVPKTLLVFWSMARLQKYKDGCLCIGGTGLSDRQLTYAGTQELIEISHRTSFSLNVTHDEYFVVCVAVNFYQPYQAEL